jgi:virulence factor Mce-like protein
MARRGTSSIVASPVLVGAVTVLVIVVAMFLAYNANQGLPFVPTYEVRAELPSGANLVKGNEVRVGGLRVGFVDGVDTETIVEDGENKAVAVVDLKLDRQVEPLPIDTRVLVRPRSSLGLKYVELTPGQSQESYVAGATIPLANAGEPVEVDDLLNTFDDRLREDTRTTLVGLGDALAGRGQSVNAALAELPALFRGLAEVMDVLNDESTELDQFFVQIGRTMGQVAPVARVQAELVIEAADTLEALSRDPAALQATIEGAPPTLDEGIQSFPVDRPFLADLADLSRRLRPAAQELPRSLPAINSALVRGQDVLPRTVQFSRRTADVLRAVDDLAEDPNTRLALSELIDALGFLGPAISFIAPYSTVCNYPQYQFHKLGEHISERVGGGTTERIELASDNRGIPSEKYDGASQANVFSDSENSRSASLPPGVPAKAVYDEEATALGPFVRSYAAVNPRAITPSGKADCEMGQWGYISGKREGLPRRDTETVRYDVDELGGRFVALAPHFPGVSGPTFTGVPSLQKIDGGHPNSLRRP